jgi:hypothetical protein
MRMFRRVASGSPRMTGEMAAVPAAAGTPAAGMDGVTQGAPGGFEFYQQ